MRAYKTACIPQKELGQPPHTTKSGLPGTPGVRGREARCEDHPSAGRKDRGLRKQVRGCSRGCHAWVSMAGMKGGATRQSSVGEDARPHSVLCARNGSSRSPAKDAARTQPPPLHQFPFALSPSSTNSHLRSPPLPPIPICALTLPTQSHMRSFPLRTVVSRTCVQVLDWHRCVGYDCLQHGRHPPELVHLVLVECGREQPDGHALPMAVHR
eukprot:scaffold4550_cov128-Isochrysis_galbana.AAC.3